MNTGDSVKQLIVTAGAVLWLLAGGVAHAQSIAVSGGAGVGRLWDDETNLGTGTVLAAGVAAGLGDHVRVSGDVDWLSHRRTLTYLRADGDAVGLFGRASYVFGPAGRRVRPLVGGGLGIIRSTGTLRTPGLAMGPGGEVVVSTTPNVAIDWSLTKAAWELHTGVRVGAGRFVLQPEVRWRASAGADDFRPAGGIEPPLLGVQGLVSLEWRLK